MKVVFSLMLSLVLTGCSTQPLGPINTPYFETHLKGIVLPSDGVVTLSGSGVWLSNYDGFYPSRSNSTASIKRTQIEGVIILTDNALLVAQWSAKENEYKSVKRFDINSIKNIYFDTLGFGAVVAVQWNDSTNDSFQFSQAGGVFIDKDKTLALYSTLKRTAKTKEK